MRPIICVTPCVNVFVLFALNFGQQVTRFQYHNLTFDTYTIKLLSFKTNNFQVDFSDYKRGKNVAIQTMFSGFSAPLLQRNTISATT